MSFEIGNAMERRRIDWLDIAKFIGITIMIMGHIGLPVVISDFIHYFHMPLFFILAGMGFNDSKYTRYAQYVLSRIKGLLVPYFSFAIISYVLYRVFPFLQKDDHTIGVKEFIYQLLTHDASKSIFSGFGVIQWFFTSLFITSIISWGIIMLCNQLSNRLMSKLVAVFICIGLAYLAGILAIPNRLGAVSAILGCSFFILGNLLRDYFIADNRGCTIVSRWYCIVLCAVLLVVICAINGNVNMRLPKYNHILLYFVGAVAGTSLVVGVSVLLDSCLAGYLRKFVLHEGSNTAIMLGLNRVAQWLVAVPIYTLIGNPFAGDISSNTFYVLFILLCELLIFIPTIYVVNRFIPFIVGKKRY